MCVRESARVKDISSLLEMALRWIDLQVEVSCVGSSRTWRIFLQEKTVEKNSSEEGKGLPCYLVFLRFYIFRAI